MSENRQQQRVKGFPKNIYIYSNPKLIPEWSMHGMRLQPLKKKNKQTKIIARKDRAEKRFKKARTAEKTEFRFQFH